MTDKEYKDRLDSIISALAKDLGKGSLMRSSSIPEEVDVIPTGIIGIDKMLGVGGIPRGRITEIYGPESCLSGDTIVKYAIRDSAGIRQNHKGGTIKRLYERFNTIEAPGKGNYQRFQTVDSTFTVPSVTDEGLVVHNKVQSVLNNGTRSVYELRTNNGLVIRATANHPFFNGTSYIALENLKEGQEVYIHTKQGVGQLPRTLRHETTVKYHPNRPRKCINGHLYYRMPISHMYWEAYANNMDIESYRNLLNEGERASPFILANIKTIPRYYHVHHLDGNHENNQRDNLVLVDSVEHGLLHAKDCSYNTAYRTHPDIIRSIRYAGKEEVYDIVCNDPIRNFVANGFQVHNSGKSTLALHVIAEAQKRGYIASYIDAEHAFDPEYARDLGVDIEALLISQPDSGEQALEVVEALVRTGEVALVVVDSVASLVPKAELEGDMGQSFMGLQARLMGQAMRKLTGVTSKSNTALVFINQIREKLGIAWGNPEVTPGGRALKFNASLRIDLRRGSVIEHGSEQQGFQCKVKTVKNKLAAPFKHVEVPLIFGKGFDATASLVQYSIQQGLIQKQASWYTYGEQKFQGIPAVSGYLDENPEIKQELEDQINGL